MMTLHATVKQARQEAIDLVRATQDLELLNLLLAILPQPAIPWELIDINAKEPTIKEVRADLIAILAMGDDESLRAARTVLRGEEYICNRVVTHHLDGRPFSDEDFDRWEASNEQVRNGGGTSHEEMERKFGLK